MNSTSSTAFAGHARRDTDFTLPPLDEGTASPSPPWRELVPHFLKLFLPAVVAILALAYGHHQYRGQHQIELDGAVLEASMDHLVGDIRRSFGDIIADLQVLATSTRLRQVASGESAPVGPVQASLIRFMRLKARYDQLRFLDARGQERVRIERYGDEVRAVPRSELQDKSERYYFEGAMTVPRGGIYISPLDLNVEHGEVGRPLKPMIRFAVPVYAQDGSRSGVVVLNYLAERLLTRLRRAAGRLPGEVHLLNRDGYWLLAPEPDRSWGFMLPERADLTFGRRYPRAWQMIQRGTAGVRETQRGRFFFDTVRVQGGSSAPTAGTTPVWKVVVRQPLAPVSDALVQPLFLALYGLAGLGAGYGAWYRARFTRQQRAHLRHLRGSRAALHEQLVERTRALRASHARLELLLSSTGEGLCGMDRQGRCTFVNHAGLDILGYTEEGELLGRPLHGVLQHSRSDRSPMPMEESPLLATYQGGEAIHRQDEYFRRADGTPLPVEYRALPMVRDGEVVGAVLTFTDITSRRRSEERLRLAARLFTHATEGIVIADEGGRVIDVNRAFSAMTGYSRDEALGQTLEHFRSSMHSPQVYADALRRLREDGEWSGELWVRHRRSSPFLARLSVSIVDDDLGKAPNYVAVFSDVTAIREQQRQMEHAAHYDALTGLPNRTLLVDRIAGALAHAQAKRHNPLLCVAYVDLDDFSAVNARLERRAGDQLLREVATRIRQTVRAGDIVARVAGDEFAVLLVDLEHRGDAVRLLKRLLAAISQSQVEAGGNPDITASIGVTYYPQPEEVDADQLLRQGAQATYQAKLEGKNRIHVFDLKMDRHTRGWNRQLEDIRRGLEADEFVLHYQPKVNMGTGEVMGAEALVRWQHPERGLLAPGVFLPAIENHPLSLELGRRLMDQALAQVQEWRAQGLGLAVSVNVSTYQIQQPDFLEDLERALAAHPGVRREDLELEILETSALEELGVVSKVMCACRSTGIRFALDDFGTGYSTLTYLRRLPANILKVDRSFVRNILEDPQDLAILKGILDLGLAFECEVLAEGVETVEHGEILLQLGFRLAQGFGIAKPMPADQLAGWVEQWRPPERWTRTTHLAGVDITVLFAIVQHRAWCQSVLDHLEDRSEIPPDVAEDNCRFGRWMEGPGRALYGSHAGFQAIERQHRGAHELAGELLQMKANDPDADMAEGIEHLRQQRDTLVAGLQGFLGNRHRPF